MTLRYLCDDAGDDHLAEWQLFATDYQGTVMWPGIVHTCSAHLLERMGKALSWEMGNDPKARPQELRLTRLVRSLDP